MIDHLNGELAWRLSGSSRKKKLHGGEMSKARVFFLGFDLSPWFYLPAFRFPLPLPS